MRYHNITKDDMLNGDGLRVVLWVAGCEHHCPECQNPITWDICGGIPFDDEAKQEIFDELEKPYISGITFSGGDPLHKKNREETGKLIEEIRDKYPKKTIWVYTGYEWQDVKDLPFIDKVDVLVDGRFEIALKDVNLPWRGSSNQKVIDVKKSLELSKIVLLTK
jgi:anaerobic ribonucleoside-triphosphate reductase activating protein